MNTTTTTLQGGVEQFKSCLLAPSMQSEDERLEMQEAIADLHISQHLNQMILSGIIDIYVYRAKNKAMQYKIYKFEAKHIINRMQSDADKYRNYLNRFEKDYLCQLLASTTPAHVDSYTNSGGVMVRLQNHWRTKYAKLLDDLYVVFMRKAEHFGAKFPDFMACIDMVRFASALILEDARVTYNAIKELAIRRWKVKTPDFSNVESIISRCEELWKLFYKHDPKDGFLNKKLESLGNDFVESVYSASNSKALESTVLASVMDYTDFYIARTVQLLQQKKLTEYITRAIREDFDNIDSEPEALFNDCMAEMRYLADTLPEYDDIEDLKEVICGISQDVSIPDTPALDKFRQKVIEVRKNGRPNEITKGN